MNSVWKQDDVTDETRHKDEPLEQLHDHVSFSADQHATATVQLTAAAPSEILKATQTSRLIPNTFCFYEDVWILDELSFEQHECLMTEFNDSTTKQFSAQAISSLPIQHFNCSF